MGVTGWRGFVCRHQAGIWALWAGSSVPGSRHSVAFIFQCTREPVPFPPEGQWVALCKCNRGLCAGPCSTEAWPLPAWFL